MTDNSQNWLKPEEALTRFKKPKDSLLKKQESEVSNKTQRYGFVINNIGFLIAEKTLSEVVKNAKIFPIPNTKKWMRGLVNLRGNLVPVYDLPVLTGLSEELSSIDNLLVLGGGSESVAVLIDRLPRTCDTSEWQMLPSVPCQLAGLEDHVTESYSAQDTIWVNFNEKAYFENIKNQVAI